MLLLNARKEIDGITQSVVKRHVQYTQQIAALLKTELANKTPVDTGFAKASWSVKNNAQGAVIENTAPYIDRLNAGSSKQAPAFFIEQTALKYGTPKGAIVEPTNGSAQGQ